MAREYVASMTMSQEEYEKLAARRIKEGGRIVSVSEALRELVIPALNNGHNPIDNPQDDKPEDKPVEQQDSKPEAKPEAKQEDKHSKQKVSIVMDNGETLNF